MQIGMTEGLRKHLKADPFFPWPEYDKAFIYADEDLFYCWEANRVVTGDREFLVLMNAENHFCCIREMDAGTWHVEASDWGPFAKVVRSLITSCLKLHGFTKDAIDTYLLYAGRFLFGKTHSAQARSALTALVRVCKRQGFDESVKGIQAALTEELNTTFPSSSFFASTPLSDMIHSFTNHRIDDPLGNGRWRVSGPEPALDRFGQYSYMSLTSPANHPVAQIEETPAEVTHCDLCENEACVSHAGQLLCLACYLDLVDAERPRDPSVRDKGRDDEFYLSDADGITHRFQIKYHRGLAGPTWGATEIVTDDDPRQLNPFARVRVQVVCKEDETERDALERLFDKVAHVLRHPCLIALTSEYDISDRYPTNADNNPLIARSRGWGELCPKGRGDMLQIVIDGHPFTGDEFLQLLHSYEGDVLRWEVVSRYDPTIVDVEEA